MPVLTRRAALLALVPVIVSRPLPALAAPGAAGPGSEEIAALPGTYALPDGRAMVSATLTLAAAPASSGARVPAQSGSRVPAQSGSRVPAQSGARILDTVMTRLGAPKPITRYDLELSKRLHLIAVSGDLETFLHEHGERPGTDGHFRVPMTFPRNGVWHVYADAVPAGLGQQVMRFEVDLDGGSVAAPRPAAPTATGLEGRDGRYGIRFDALDLRAGQEATLALHVLRDGQPAPDLTPYLGVAAHAVFISAADLTYVHAHAAPAITPAVTPAITPAITPAARGTGAPMKGGMGGMAMPGMDHGGMPGTGGAPMRTDARVAPELTLHVRAPRAGTYKLWLQFMAGGQVRTVPFVVAVA